MIKTISIFSIFLFLITSVTAQTRFSLSGTVIDSTSNNSIAGSTIILKPISDTTKQLATMTNEYGKFEFNGLVGKSYFLHISFIGYKSISKQLDFENDKQLDFKLQSAAIELSTVQVTGTAIQATQNGDTTQYNAKAVKVHTDASAEELVQKLPGVTVENGQVKAQGQEIKKIKVDGKEFFGSDPSVALKNLPADMIENVQVFDQASDQSRLTGFDDGNSERTMNITTKKSRQNGYFGKMYAGYGTQDRYAAGASVNHFKNTRRITLTGLFNNVNVSDFALDDILGATASTGGGGGFRFRSRGGSGSAFQFQQNGINTTNSIGLQLSNEWKKMKFSGSYSFDNRKNEIEEIATQAWFSTTEEIKNYLNNYNANNNNFNHRMNFRLEYAIDSLNTLIFSPRVSYQTNNAKSFTTGWEYFSDDTLSLSNRRNESNGSGYNISGDLFYSHKFKKKGRSISMNLNSGQSKRDSKTLLFSDDYYYQAIVDTNLIRQKGTAPSASNNVSSNISYTEPVGKKSLLQISYNLGLSNEKIDKKTYNQDSVSNEYTSLDTLLSNEYKSQYTTHRVGGGYRYNNGKLNLNTSITYQHATLDGRQTYPSKSKINKAPYTSLLPNFWMEYKISKEKNLRVNIRTSTNAPSITQLQSVINNNNPQLLTTGNPNLDQQYRVFVMSNYAYTNTEKSSNFFMYAHISKSYNYIGSSTFTPVNDTTINEYFVSKSRRLTMPVNLNGQWSSNLFTTYGFPLKSLKSTLNFNLGMMYSHSPNLINFQRNITNNYTPNGSLSISSNISEKIDFTLSYNAQYKIGTTTLQTTQNNNYLSQTGSLKTNFTFFKTFVWQNQFSYQYYSGIDELQDPDFLLWNMSVGKKFLKNNRAELKLSVFDILNQNRAISHTVNDLYIEDNVTNALTQYFMLTFTYNLRNFPPPKGTPDGQQRIIQQGDGGGFQPTR